MGYRAKLCFNWTKQGRGLLIKMELLDFKTELKSRRFGDLNQLSDRTTWTEPSNYLD